MQQQYLLRVVAHVEGNKARAAEILGVGRSTISQILSRIRLGDDLKSVGYSQDPAEELNN